MRRLSFPFLFLFFLLGLAATSRAQDAKATAQDILTKGAALFDTRDAAAMAETYLDDARVTLIEKNSDSHEPKAEVKDGRREIEGLYKKLWENPGEKTTSRNTVEYAKFIGDDLLTIEGEFEPKVGAGAYSFTQVRVKSGGRWLIQDLRLYIVPKR